jgi:hypothetical protein
VPISGPAICYISGACTARGSTVARNFPTMVASFTAVAKGLQKKAAAGAETTAASRLAAATTDRDLPGSFVFGGIAVVVTVSWLVPGIFAGGMDLTQRAVCAAGVGIFGVLFVAVAARIVGIVGVSSQPTSGIALVPRRSARRRRLIDGGPGRCSPSARSSRSPPRRPGISRRT